MKIVYFDEIDSTNDYCKTQTQDLIVVAARQTTGRGTKGRNFISQEGGVYLSVVKFDVALKSSQAFKIMVNTAVAVCKTLEDFALSPVIKWPNDVLVNGKKISGTLIENTFCGSVISRSIVGVGINVNNALVPELTDIATTVALETKDDVCVAQVREKLIEYIQREYSISDYKRRVDWFGKKIKLIKRDGVKTVVAKDVTDDGRLVVEDDCGKCVAVSSAEVSLRF